WLITGALCGVAGTVAGMNSDSFSVASGSEFLIPIIAASILGGAGSPYGAMIGAVLIGEMTEISAAIISPEYKQVVAFAVLVLVMVLRPQGLLAKRGALAAAGGPTTSPRFCSMRPWTSLPAWPSACSSACPASSTSASSSSRR